MEQSHSPIVSIITTVYHVLPEDFSACIESVFKQCFEDWEWIVYCDGDKTFLPDNERFKNDSRVRIIRGEERRGAAYGRKQAIRLARGEFIAIQDADDCSLPNRLTEEVQFLQQHPEMAWVGSSMQLFDEQGDYAVWSKKERPQPIDCLYDIPSLHGSILFRKSALASVQDYRISSQTQRGQDYDLLMRMMACGLRGYNLSQVLYRYRRSRHAFYRRSLRLCWNECRVRWHGFMQLGLLPRGFFYVFKPLISWIIPAIVLQKIRPPKKINRNK